MNTNVYINDKEACSKASDGKSAGAFPDPCWSPPGPSAGPIVKPYSNTAKANQLAKGTSSVFICGTMVAMEDKSYFASSEGNSGATSAFPKGFATNVINGKAYFQTWSLDVRFEGHGVPRHEDLMTHNHGSFPSNTATFPYLSKSIWNDPCSKERDKIDKACAPETEESESKQELKKKSKYWALIQSRRRKKPKKLSKNDNKWHWTDDHCDGLEIPIVTAETAKEYVNEMKSIFEKIPDEINLFAAAKSLAKDMIENAVYKAGSKVVFKFGVKQLAGSAVPAAGNAVMAAWSLADVVMAVGDVAEIKSIGEALLEKIEVVEDQLDETKKLLNDIKSDEKNIQDLAVDSQKLLATLNDCTRARKCNLVPHEQDLGVKNKVESADRGGCCPGQTGHHLIPESSIKDTCPNYKHSSAPTVCVEGINQHFGSHKRIHESLAKIHAKIKDSPQMAGKSDMSLNQAIDSAALSHQLAFPLSKCSKACIEAQLKNYYETMCGGSRVNFVDSNGRKI